MKFRKNSENKRTVTSALVLSGGGAKGAYQVGVIKELLARKIRLDLVTGSSIGAFNGALLAEFINMNYSGEEICARLEEVWKRVGKFLSINWGGIIKNLHNPLRVPSIFTNREINNLIRAYIPAERRFSDYTACQLSVTGTNLDKRDTRMFDFNSTTSVPRAVLASMAYPVAFPAVTIEGDSYIDGGALDNAPLKEAILWGARQIYVVFLTPLSLIEGDSEENNSNHRHNESEYSALEVIDNFLDMASTRLMYGDLRNAEKINRLITLLGRYEHELPSSFVDRIRQLFGMKSEDNKRYIRIIKIAPERELKPPGAMGFDETEVLAELMQEGEKDAREAVI